MTTPVYIGDEASAAGYRLAGVRVQTPASAAVPQALQAALASASLVMLSARLAAALPQQQLERLLAQVDPPLLIVPDLSGGTPPPDLATRLRRELGMLE